MEASHPYSDRICMASPNLAESFCKNALYRDDVRTYCAFDTPHLGLDTKNFVADVFVENILYLGDTRSADDLSVFTKMAPERLCLGCGLRVDEPFAPISTGERKKLFYAAQKLLTFVLHEVSAQTLSAEETALKIALRPLIINKDGHFVAAVTSMYQSLLEGKTGLPHQRCLWCWQNPLGRCHDCRSASHGSVLDNHDCHKGKCCCACLR